MNKVLVIGLVLLGAAGGLSLWGNKPETIVSSQANDTVISTISMPAVKNEEPTVTTQKKVIKNYKLDLARSMVLEGPISKNAVQAARYIEELNNESSAPIYVLLDNSPGGSVIDGAVLVSAIESSKAPVYTICLRICASMAAIIHQYGTKRLMTDRSVLMFHSASAGTSGTVEQMLSFSKFLNRYIEKFERQIVSRSKFSYDEYKKLIQHEIWMDSEDSTAHGLNDEIISINPGELSEVSSLKDEKKTVKSEAKTRVESLTWEYKK